MVLTTSCLHQQDQLNAKIDDQSKYAAGLEERVAKLERELGAKQDLFTELEKRVKTERADNQVLLQDMRVEIQGVKGELEELRHDLQRTRTDLDAFKADTTQREVDKLRSGKAEDDLAVYDRTLKIILEEKDYALAIDKFKEFTKRYPKSTLADNAAYWIGEGHYALGQYKEAVLEFQNVIENYPKSDKVCAALLKQAFSFEQLRDKTKAKLFFEETISRCKKKPEAKTAKKQLAGLK